MQISTLVYFLASLLGVLIGFFIFSYGVFYQRKCISSN